MGELIWLFVSFTSRILSLEMYIGTWAAANAGPGNGGGGGGPAAAAAVAAWR